MESLKQPCPLGHVIRILDKFTLIIDVGNDRVSVGDLIDVYELGDVLTGIDGKVICNFVYIKDTLKVVETQDNYSICKKEKKVVHAFQAFSSISPLLEEDFYNSIPLDVDDSEITPLTSIHDPKIHVGDLVKPA